MPRSLEHLRSEVSYRATETGCAYIVIDAFFRKTEVSEKDMSFLVNDNIVWLEVSIDDVSSVKVL
jgi:hypothetical protein